MTRLELIDSLTRLGARALALAADVESGAVVESDTPVQMDVLYGANAKSWSNIDRATVRQFRDELSRRGVPNYKIVSPTTVRLRNWDGGIRASTSMRLFQTPTIGELDEFFSKHEAEILAAAVVGRRAACRDGVRGITPTTAAVAYALFARSDRAAADSFFDSFITGENLASGDPRLKLRKYLEPQHVRGAKRPLIHTDGDALEALITAWNHFRRNRKMRHFPQPTGTFAEPV